MKVGYKHLKFLEHQSENTRQGKKKSVFLAKHNTNFSHMYTNPVFEKFHIYNYNTTITFFLNHIDLCHQLHWDQWKRATLIITKKVKFTRVKYIHLF